ncbi:MULTISPECIES: amylo-alpha-1,6-glucosidase [Dyella]|uniref:Amylo-alpha-1,6-glucosidase n=2 Tax=Dyella TaxID=231454 RepID=A0A4R0Z0Q8_9GAMM|nr:MULTISPECIES: amylo-alpha-1,6-glucosidase [Dyella]TBR39456.1 amylo-alpha-1,6-glucosidase [Dyella terrae]TCI12958.1 amylo-alpha-1,6-glucosidase [Dyella soli]
MDDAFAPNEITGDLGIAETRSMFALKAAHSFAVCDAHGDMLGGAEGMFRNDTRVLSHWILEVGGARPSLLSGAISHDNVLFTAELTNEPLPPTGGVATPAGVIHIQRIRLLWENRLFEEIRLHNFDDRDLIVPVRLRFHADFRDIFEVRGMQRERRGEVQPPRLQGDHVVLGYRGLDHVDRRSTIAFSAKPSELQTHRAQFSLPLPRMGTVTLYVEVGDDHVPPTRERFRHAAACARATMRNKRHRGACLKSNARMFNAWLDRSRADIALLVADLPTGPYPYAGIPWFSTPFGRDGLITAMQTLWVDPSLARGVLGYLSSRQATEISAFRDSAPGKIMHETRAGEMAALGEVPFGLYYGGVDSTPLFIMLAGDYAKRTADDAFIDQLWPSLLAAMSWIDAMCDNHGHGFLAYARGAEGGLVNQGWKDSNDSVFHADGRIPEGPIALIEVQGYLYAALRAMARMAERRGDDAHAQRWRQRALALRQAVEELFWDDDLSFYGIARDGADELCRVRASNVGHLLYTGLPRESRARKVIRQLRSAAFDGGWGVRTLAYGQARYNPMSYHDGSVWPHDVAMCTAGMAHYGERHDVVRLVSEVFEAASQFGMRLPELFCGFPRRTGEPPVAYPVACMPQAWAAGSMFMLMQSCLGVSIDGRRGVVHVRNPRLPEGIDRLCVNGLEVAGQRFRLGFERIGGRIATFRDGGSNDIRIQVDL